jgi:general L-amino acid transport system permease protein
MFELPTATPPLTNSLRWPRRRLMHGTSARWIMNICSQAAVVGVVVAAIWYLASMTNQNLRARGVIPGFGFLDRPSSVPIAEHLIEYKAGVSTYARALVVGLLNTLNVSCAAIILSTVLGTLIGVSRLSSNWFLERLSTLYIETVRNVPLLLQLLFWYQLLNSLPAPRQALRLFDVIFLSNRGIRIPVVSWEPSYRWVLAAFVLGGLCAVGWVYVVQRRRDTIGQSSHVFPVVIGLPLFLPLLTWWMFGAQFALDKPTPRGFDFQGGVNLTPEYSALLIGLVIYAAAYTAEIVRAGILAVDAGQREAAEALGLRRGATLRLVVLPQALRLVIPPMASDYLNILKNSSLAVIIGYQDIASVVSSMINETGQAVEGVTIIMAAYLTISLPIALFMNWYNEHIALARRFIRAEI